jgi:hypothetical protein
MRKLLWVLGGVIVGVLLANLVAYGWEAMLLPLMPFAELADADAMQADDLDDDPALPAQLWVAFGWLLSTFVGAFAAFRISYWDFAGWVVAAVFAAMSLGYLLSEPFPFWMRLSAVAVPFVGALFAFGLYRRWRAAHLHLHRARR